jgi:acetyl-CoA carboxylase biotin carboxyl carrier protein
VTEQEQPERELSDDAPADHQDDVAADGRANDELQARILAAVDRLAPALTGGPLEELEVESGDLVVRLAKPRALPALAGSPASSATEPTAGTPSSPYGEPDAGMRFVTAPLTGVWYTAPSPGARSYVSAGGEVAMGQVVGLIEAMKLFNEIKSDVAGTVTRILAETGTLVKRQQPLLEVDPS